MAKQQSVDFFCGATEADMPVELTSEPATLVPTFLTFHVLPSLKEPERSPSSTVSVLSLVAGLYAPSSGSIEVLGTTPALAKKRIGYMLQRDELLEWRTIEKNVLLGLEIRRELNEKTRKKAKEMLDFFRGFL